MTEDGHGDDCDERKRMSMNIVFVSFTSDFPAQQKPLRGRCGSCKHNSIHKIDATSGTAKACESYDHTWDLSGDAHVPASAHQVLVAVCSKYLRFESKTEVNELTGSAGSETEKR